MKRLQIVMKKVAEVAVVTTPLMSAALKHLAVVLEWHLLLWWYCWSIGVGVVMSRDPMMSWRQCR